MFRRRPIRRRVRPLRDGRRRGTPRALITANRMLEAGSYQEAAERFETIARAAEARGGVRAPQFYLQAGRAHILSGNNKPGLAHIRHGLSLLAGQRAWPHLYRVGNRTIATLTERGLTAEADEISAWLEDNLPADFDAVGVRPQTKNPVLPTHCPSCGAALRPGEVEWLDEVTAECTYCGSPVREGG